MILRDWRQVDAHLLRACYAREQRSWHQDLGWDTAWTWSTVEQARVTWGLPGLVAFDEAGAVEGWTFYMREHETVHIGGLTTASPRATGPLVDAILGNECVAASEATTCFVRERAAGVVEALVARQFDVERFLYLSRPLQPLPAAASVRGSRDWRAADVAAASALLEASYTADAGRHFAPRGTVSEWMRYVAGVVEQRGCGVLESALSRVLGEDRLDGLALVTSLASRTAHLAQLAVHPGYRRRGVASDLLTDVIVAAGNAGKQTLTLLVSERNLQARRLYASMGFTQCGTFVAGRRDAAVSGLPQAAYLPTHVSEPSAATPLFE